MAAYRPPTARHRRYHAGTLRCGYVSRRKPWYIHALGATIALVTFLFSYAALMENGLSHAVASFLFGFAFLLLVYGHHLDSIYIHVGDKLKIGAQSYNPGAEIPVGGESEEDSEDGSNFERLE